MAGDRAVLVEADAPMLVNDPGLAKSGVVELSTWSVALLPGSSEAVAPLIRPTLIRQASVASVCAARAGLPVLSIALLTPVTRLGWLTVPGASSGRTRPIY